MSRTVRGVVELPADAPDASAGVLLVEARDVTLQDAPSVVVAEARLPDVHIEPGSRVPFELQVPDAPAGHTLAMRVHVSMDGTPAVSHGDGLSVTHIPVPPAGDVDDIEVPVRIV
jgi:putative lipoprotein